MLDRYAHKRVLVDITEDDNTSTVAKLTGFRLAGIALPAALTVNGGLTVTPQVDPGDGTFRTVTTEASADITFTTVVAGDLMILPIAERIPGARIRLEFSISQAADREVFLLLEQI